MHLPWVEYAHNTLISSAMGMSPFVVTSGYQPPLFPGQESDAGVPSVQAQFQRVHRAWKEACTALSRTAERNQRLADFHRTLAPAYQVGKQVRLSRDLPLQTYSLAGSPIHRPLPH